MVGGVGQRMLASVSRRMAGEFFGNVAATLAGGGAAPTERVGMPDSYVDAVPGVFTAPARASSPDDFVKGIAVGAGLVVLGVVVGAVFGRRR